MKRLKKIICAALAAAILTAGFASCSEKKQIDMKSITLSKKQVADVQSKIDKTLDEVKYSGAVYVKLNKNVIYEKYIGYENPDKTKSIDENTRYQVSSLSKNITGVAILQLADEGKLSFDDTLDKYFDASGDRAYLSDITITELVDREISFGAYNSELLQKEKEDHTVSNFIKKGSGLKDYITEYILDRGIDEGGNQTNSSYYLLGIIVEKVSGEPFKDYIKKNIFDKIGMTETEVVSQTQPLTGYNTDSETWRNQKSNPYYNDYEFMFSAFGITSTINDLSKFYNAILEGKLTKTDLIKKIDSFYTNYGFGFRNDGHNFYSYGGTSLHTTYSYINNETKELALLCSNQSGAIRLNATGKAVYNAVNAKINGMLLDEE